MNKSVRPAMRSDWSSLVYRRHLFRESHALHLLKVKPCVCTYDSDFQFELVHLRGDVSPLPLLMIGYRSVCVCVWVGVLERERKRTKRTNNTFVVCQSAKRKNEVLSVLIWPTLKNIWKVVKNFLLWYRKISPIENASLF
jgi:hypothetical protein